MWSSDQVEFTALSIRGKEFDPKIFGILTVIPPRADAPYWEIEFDDGSKLVTNDVITIRYEEKQNGTFRI